MKFDNTGDHVERVIHMTATASGQRSTLAPRTLHRPVGRRDARDRHDRLHGPTRPASALNVPSGPGKHTVERLTLTEDRTRLRYEVTVEDPTISRRRPR